MSHHHTLLDSRKRQSKRDEAIRRKIENDLSKKKRPGSTTTTRRRKASPGSVLALRPSDPLICKATTTAFQAAQLMSARRENCALVINEAGIFTAKDLAFRIVGSGLNPNQVTVDQIMTSNPICVHSNDPAGDALNLMVEKGFRHLPVLEITEENQVGQIVGVLDITKSYAQQMEKLEKLNQSSETIRNSLTQIGQQPQHIVDYFTELGEKMKGPILESVLNVSTHPIYVQVKQSVAEATVMMKEHRTTAVLVKDTNNEVAGIFTSKDVVLRVIAAGLDANTTSVLRVMTPQPDVATSDLSIQSALRQMFEGHYLNLPVVGDEDEIIGIVDVLKLTHATLNQLKEIETTENSFGSATAAASSGEGPAWNKFWNNMDDGEGSDAHSNSIVETTTNSGGFSSNAAAPDVTPSEFNSFNIDIKPSDSVSHVESLPLKSSTFGSSSLNIDEIAFTFKFTSPGIDGRAHRIVMKSTDGVAKLRELISGKLHDKDYAALNITKDEEDFAISYVDDEGDVVHITTDDDLNECIFINLKLQNDKADIYLHNPHEHAPIEKIKSIHKKSKSGSNSLIPGIPNEILIPTVLAILGASAIFGYNLSRK
ncbi:mug70 Meiotically up-regulated gene 70 protein [Candida maltosa Xu316]